MKKNFFLTAVFICSFSFAQNSETKITVQQIQKEFKYKKYSKDVLKTFAENIYTDQYGELFEYVPGEIIGYSFDNGTAVNRKSAAYIIKGNNLVSINPYPVNDTYDIDKNFDYKVSIYAGKNWRFEDRAGYNIKKLKNANYLISTEYYKNNQSSEAPSGYLEYLTKDFKTFIPYRISENGKKWKMIN